MKKYKILFYIFLTLTVALNVFIIVEGCLPGGTSESQSNWIGDAIAKAMNITPSKEFYRTVRKVLGHFCFFGLDGLISTLTAFFYLKKKGTEKNWLVLILTCVFGLIVAFISELVQLITPNRYFAISDVLIDFCGFLLGFFIIAIIVLIINTIKNKKLEASCS